LERWWALAGAGIGREGQARRPHCMAQATGCISRTGLRLTIRLRGSGAKGTLRRYT
jgi:hypothetical protein